MVGAGALAQRLIAAHAAVRPITHVTIWNRTPRAAERLAASLDRPGLTVTATRDLAAAVSEADDEAIRRARVYVDTLGGALKEAGDIVQPISAGLIGAADIAGDLFDLCRGTVPGRQSDGEITLFKSVGSAIEDLAAAILVWRRIMAA